MRMQELDYDLPPELVAQEPAGRREAARLMVLRRSDGTITEASFGAIGEHLRPGDLLVLNDTRVVPARLEAHKPTGGRVDLLLVACEGEDGDEAIWTCLASSGRGIRPGVRLRIAPGFEAEILGEIGRGRIRLRLWADGRSPREAIERFGLMPLPPYIRRASGDSRSGLDRERYQTVYARHPGAIAAPTAGLHFTEELMRALEGRGVRFARLTLHVGPGTFQPVRSEHVEDHRVEAEAYRLPPETVEAVAACRARGGRVVAVGTTATRVLEERADEGGRLAPGEGHCDLTIVPGHRFRVVDALITNFHLPRTTLIVLASAFAGRERILAAYREAVARRFRFYSYGDAMMIE